VTHRQQQLLLAAALFPLPVAALPQAALPHSQAELQVQRRQARAQLESSAATSEPVEFERVRPKIKVRSRQNYRRSAM
jgi:hypothetical protein